jgi:hypothetical protein
VKSNGVTCAAVSCIATMKNARSRMIMTASV